jgi:hypothetical protein
MGAKQTKSCGSYADVKELEYISALHQTGTNGLRKDGSIRGTLELGKISPRRCGRPR